MQMNSSAANTNRKDPGRATASARHRGRYLQVRVVSVLSVYCQCVVSTMLSAREEVNALSSASAWGWVRALLEWAKAVGHAVVNTLPRQCWNF